MRIVDRDGLTIQRDTLIFLNILPFVMEVGMNVEG
jgi:hypothetical protein